jgi:5-methylcytosine-specific restriction endonuclease McrA
MTYTCRSCGGHFDEPPRPGIPRTYCPAPNCKTAQKKAMQRSWAERNPDRIREAASRRRATKRGAPAERIDLLAVAERDHWRCQICLRKLNPRLQWPHPNSQSLDHVVPLSRGGEHTAANAQLAHLACNVGKGNRGGGEQLALLG